MASATKYGNSAPMIKAPTREQQAQLSEIEYKLSAAEKTFAALATDTARVQRSWEKLLDRSKPILWSVDRGITSQFPLDSDTDSHFDGKRAAAEQGDQGKFGFLDKFSIAAWINPAAPTGALVTRTA